MARAAALAVLAAAAVAGVSAQAWSYQQCFDEYLCIFHYLNPGSSLSYKYSWDFRPLCRGSGSEYSWTDGSNHTYRWNICGMVSQPCVPIEYKVYVGMGVATQQWTDNPPCGPQPACTLPESGQAVCCTGDCTVLAHDIPRYELMDPNNPVTGGIIISHAGMPPDSADPSQCPPDPTTGCSTERQLTFYLSCDQSSSDTSKFTFLQIEENPVCHYNIYASSPAACASKGDPFDPYKDNPGDSFGFVVLGSVLTIFTAFTYSFGEKRGWWDPIKARLPARCGGGGSYSRASSGGFASSSKSAATPISASAYGST